MTGTAFVTPPPRTSPHPDPAPSVVQQLVSEIAARLEAAGIPNARNEARDLVAAVTEAPRFWPSLAPQAVVSSDVVGHVRRAAVLRASGAPFAYAVGRAAFRYLTLFVDERVLIPRSETELLVEIVLAMVRGNRDLHLVDVGTGSGAIAIALASEGPFSRVVATDLSLDALQVASSNTARHATALRSPIELRHGAGLAPVAGERFDVVVSNPPYIAFNEADALPRSVRDWEPAHALVCGAGGLDVTIGLVNDAPAHTRPGGILALEVDERRAGHVGDCIRQNGAWTDVTIHHDLAGRERFVTARRCD